MLDTGSSGGRAVAPPARVGEALPLVSVVVPIYGACPRLEACVDRLLAQTYAGPYEIIVVVNGGGGQSASGLPDSPRIKLIFEPAPGSYAARNAGMAAAAGSVFAFTDADCLPAPDWLSAGVSALLSRPDLAYVAGHIQVVPADPLRPTPVEFFETQVSFRQREYLERWHFGATANLLARREAFERVGLFDPRLMSLGDREWGLRARDAGLRGLYSDTAVVQHPARRSLGPLVARTRRTAGGFFQLVRSRRFGLNAFRRDAPVGIEAEGLPQGSRRSPGERLVLIALALLVIAVRGLELLRLGLGGRPLRA